MLEIFSKLIAHPPPLEARQLAFGQEGLYPQIYTVLNFGMTIFNFHLLLLFLANLTRNWVIFDEKMERQA